MTKALVKAKNYLPDSIDKLQEYILIGRERLRAYHLKVSAIDRLELAREVREQAVEDGQRMGEALLYAEAKLGELLRDRPEVLPSRRGSQSPLPNGITHKQSHYAQTLADHPDVIEEVIQEAKENEDIPTRTQVLQKVKAREKETKIQRIINQPIVNTSGEIKYRCIVIDPPWPVQKIERDVRPNQGIKLDYPSMSIEEIRNFNFQHLTDSDCHLYLWTTHKFLPDAFSIAEAWGFKYECLMTWVKNVGFTPYSWMYSTEHILFCRRGNLPLLKLGTRLDFTAKVREHSRKPDEFYEIIKNVSPAPRLDIFSREKREGFEQYGNETEKF